MRIASIVLLLAAALAVLPGCDFLRSVAGRPTSEEIRTRKAARASALEAQRERDSLRADSVAAMRFIGEKHIKIAPPSHSGALVPENTGSSYFVMIGTFAKKQNAEQLFRICAGAGYKPVLIPYANGYTAVAACGCVTLGQTLTCLEELKTRDFCPSDAWILSAR